MSYLSSETSSVKKFLKEYREFEDACDTSPDSCPVCDDECLKPD
jgi:hypothetical protein